HPGLHQLQRQFVSEQPGVCAVRESGLGNGSCRQDLQYIWRKAEPGAHSGRRQRVSHERISETRLHQESDNRKMKAGTYAKFETSIGNFTIELFEKETPNTVGNFVKLAEKNFYNGGIFHRVIDGFMIQGGDPTGTGRGGPGYQFADEFHPSLKHNSE